MANKERHRIIPAAYVILRRGNEILMQRRLKTGYEDGNYGLVSGHVEQGESYQGAIIREAKEEAGVTVKPEDLRFVHLLHRKDKGEDNERADVFFMIERWEGEVKNVEPQKCSDLSWFSVGNLPANTIPYIRMVIQSVEQGIFYSEHGW
ncbi:MAG TPA: NUDIX domain-containing protein [Candidatus Paceibacterota bacterium]